MSENKIDKRPLIILTGPTAVGKTNLSIRLAKAINGEIISADSMQVYKGMDIGSAKITKEEMQGIQHHLLDIYEPWEEFNVVVFQQKCKECLTGIYERGHIPILTGGTGFYIQAVLKDIDFTQNEDDNSYRLELEALGAKEGPGVLHEMLKEVDPKAAQEIHANNQKRVIRALEFYHFTGKRISEHNEQEAQKEPAYNFCYFVLNDDRAGLYERIEQRVDLMLQNGLVEEVKALIEKGCTRDMVAMQGLGYKEIMDYLDGKITLEEAIYIIKRDTRHFAKRQITWFKREKDVIWLNKPEYGYDEDAILSHMIEEMKKRGVL